MTLIDNVNSDSREKDDVNDHLSVVLAKDDIRDLVVRLARAMDRNDRQGILDCYHPGAVDHHGEFEGPVEELVDFIDLLHRERADTMYHLLGNHLITLDGDRGLGELYITAVLRAKAGPPADMIAGGRYLDHYQRRDGQWRLAERRVVLDWQRFDPVVDFPGIATVAVQERGSAGVADPSCRHLAGGEALGGRVR